MEDIGIFYGHLVDFTGIWSTLWPFGIFLVILYFSPFWYVVTRKIWQPWLRVFHSTVSFFYVSRSLSD
jgi:hypothetical protein